MAASFQNFDNISRDRAKDEVQKKSCRRCEKVRKAGRKNFFLENDSEKILEQSPQSAGNFQVFQLTGVL